MRFIAMASVSWASFEIEPKLIAPVAKRFTISLAGSTSPSGTRSVPNLNFSSPRSVQRCSCCSSMSWQYFLNSPTLLIFVESCSLATTSGLCR